ncbi:hypothetical protein BDF20DRAFT_800752, partial [Mycotypha africana]|uniref:uncharacterized protein n=1 Tax=Mycotypha africana TaxID=64632 RepID=UPI002301F86B
MCAVIDSNQSLVTSERETQQFTSADTHNDCDTEHYHEETEFSLIHYINCDELLNAVAVNFKSHSRHEKFDQKVERIRERIKDTPDFLFRVQTDGSLTLWGIQ